MKRKPVGRAATILYLSPIARASFWRRFVSSYLSTRIQNACVDVRLVRWSGDDSADLLCLGCSGRKLTAIRAVARSLGFDPRELYHLAPPDVKANRDRRPGGPHRGGACDADEIRAALLDAFDWRRQIDLAARLVARMELKRSLDFQAMAMLLLSGAAPCTGGTTARRRKPPGS
jgi:hypothetical protein